MGSTEKLINFTPNFIIHFKSYRHYSTMHKTIHHSFPSNDILQFTHDTNNTEHIKCLLMCYIRKNLIVGHK